MRYKIKYQPRGKVEPYIAYTTSYIAALATRLFEAHELDAALQGVSEEVKRQAAATSKGLTANPECEIENNALIVRNTTGREILMVYFERIYENGYKGQVKKL